MKKLISLLLALTLGLSCLTAFAESDTQVFVDSTGREVVLPAKIERIAVSGLLAQIVVFPVAPEKLVALASAWDAASSAYIATEYYDLPVLGHLYGGKAELNLEELLMAAPDVVIDVGETKGDVAGDLDALTQQTGIPFIHIAAGTDNMAEVYRTLGKLLGKEEQGEKLAVYYDGILQRTRDIAAQVEKVNLLYITGEEGHNVIAKGSYHSEVIDLLSNNLAVVDNPSSKGFGNEVGMEQILLWNPDYIIFSTESIYDDVADKPEWQTITAIQNGCYYKTPEGPYNWMSFPPSVQRLLGMMWMAKILYPETAAYDLYEEVNAYFNLFYHCELTREQYDALVQDAVK